MEYEVTDTEDVPTTDLSEVEELPPDLDIQPVSRVLDCQNIAATIWHFEEGGEDVNRPTPNRRSCSTPWRGSSR